MKKLTLTVARTLSFFTFGIVLAGVLNLIPKNPDNQNILIVTEIIAGLALVMLVLNVITACQILDTPYLSEIVPTKLIGANISLTALLLVASIATFILAMKVHPATTVYTSMYILMGLLSLPQSVTSSCIGYLLN